MIALRPTTDDALKGAERLLRSLVADGDLMAENADPVLALLAQARSSWTTRLPFLDQDNRALLALLGELRTSLPEALAADITSRLGSAAPLLDVAEADRLNAALRDLLAQAVRALPVGADRERIRLYLLDRVEREPV